MLHSVIAAHSTSLLLYRLGACRHLPRDIRVFAVQRVPARFEGREVCSARGYAYYLPASALRLRLDGGAEDAATLARLRAALNDFVGEHPFHNYTKRCAARHCAQLHEAVRCSPLCTTTRNGVLFAPAPATVHS